MKDSIDQYQNDISDLILLQNLISNLSDSNLQSTIEKIKASKFIQSRADLILLMKLIGKIIKYRRKHFQCFFSLIDEIFPIISSNFGKKEVMFYFSQKIIFLKLLHDNFISQEDIITYYGIRNSKLIYFYPEVKDRLSNNSIFKENVEDCQRYRDIINYFTDKNASTTDFHTDPRLQIGNTDKLSVLIQKDDIDTFQQMISQNNINIKTHKIKLTNFESNKCLKDETIYLLEYAAYHSSLRIFKFLLMNDSFFTSKLFQYALCGGNNEIIHLSESVLDKSEISKDIQNILMLVIICHRNELCEYLIENFDIEVSFNCLSSSIYNENYDFFFNHVLELDAKYNDLLDKKAKNEITKKETKNLKEMKDTIKEIIIFCAGDPFLNLLKIAKNFRNINLNDPIYINFDRQETDPMSNPLVYSILKFNNKNAKYLISLDSVDPDFKLFDNITPFLWACYVGNLGIVEILASNEKVNIFQIAEQSKENALHIAVRQCNFEVVKFLVSLDVFDLTAKPIKDEPVIETAARLGYKEIFEFLKSQLKQKGVAVDDNLVPSKETFYPSHYTNPLLMGIDFYSNLQDPISVCLLI